MTEEAVQFDLRAAIRDGSGMLFDADNIAELVRRLKRSADLRWSERLIQSWLSGFETPSDLERRLIASCLSLPGDRIGLAEFVGVPNRRAAARDLLAAAEPVQKLKQTIPSVRHKSLFLSDAFPERFRFALINRGRLSAKEELDWSKVYEICRYLVGVLVHEDDAWIRERSVPEEPLRSALAEALWVEPEFLAGTGWSRHTVLNR